MLKFASRIAGAWTVLSPAREHTKEEYLGNIEPGDFVIFLGKREEYHICVTKFGICELFWDVCL